MPTQLIGARKVAAVTGGRNGLVYELLFTPDGPDDQGGTVFQLLKRNPVFNSFPTEQ